MNLDLLLKLVREPASIEAANQADLEALVAEYPAFTAAQLLLLKLYKEQNSIHFSKQLRKVAAMAPSREHVYDLVEVLPSLEEGAAAGVQASEVAAIETPEPPAAGLAAHSEAELAPETAAFLEAETIAETKEVVAATDQTLEEPSLPIETWAVPEEVLATASEAFTEVVTELVETEAAVAVVPAPVFANKTQTTQPHEVVLEAKHENSEALLTHEEPMETPGELEIQSEAAVVTLEEEHLEVETAEMLGESGIADEDTAPTDSAPAASPMAAAPELGTDFIQSAHDRLSWYRYFAGKPLREQPDDVLEQLYMEHMQQDLLKAPEIAPETSIKAKVNFAEEVESSVSVEEEIKRMAYDSISDDELPASETLARIYEQQHEYKRAIKIYQKLILKFPDKMTYFAGLIEELRKKA